MAYAIKNSSTIILPKWYSNLDELELKSRIMPRDVTTRWNSTYNMLDFALKYREAIDVITGDRDMKLRKYEMDEEEWEVARQLCEVLKVRFPLPFRSFAAQLRSVQIFKDATLFFSRDGTPNIATVIPAMDRIDEVLATNALDDQYLISIKAALSMVKRTLNRYYSKTDLSDVYRIAMSKLLLGFITLQLSSYHHLVLHPRHKLQYFKNTGWSDRWIETARDMVRERFENSYKSFPGEKPKSINNICTPLLNNMP
jgi:hypothetical protein